MSHTPGRWTVSQDCYDEEGKVFRAISDSLGRTIAQTPSIPQGDQRLGSPYTRKGMESNAHLLAAAPELLACLKTALKGTAWLIYLGGLTDADFEIARTAVTHAEGRG